MKNILLILMFLIAGFSSVVAQTADTTDKDSAFDNFEGYIGYQRTKQEADKATPNFAREGVEKLNGINVSGTYYVGKNLGVTAEFGASRDGNNNSIGTAMVGGTFKAKGERFQPFVRALGGVSYSRGIAYSFEHADNRLGAAFAVGTGLDINIKKNSRYKIRIAQVDYLQSRMYNQTQHNFRFGAGFVF